MTHLEILNKLIEYSGKNASDFALLIGTTPGTISGIKSGRTQITYELARKIHNVFPEIRYEFLMCDSDEMLSAPAVSPSSSLKNDNNGCEEAKILQEERKSQPDLFSAQQLVDVKNEEHVYEQPQETAHTVARESYIEDFQRHRFEQNARTVEKIILLYSDGTYSIH